MQAQDENQNINLNEIKEILKIQTILQWKKFIIYLFIYELLYFMHGLLKML